MKKIFTILLFALLAFSANAEVCTITLTGDWSASSLRIKEPNSGVDTTITATCAVWFRGTGNATFLYMGLNGINTFEYSNCAGYDFTSPVLTNYDIYISAGVLPVELSFFNANVKESTVVLTWQTASEQNNYYFSIEKSTDGKNFKTIGTIEGHGTTTDVQDYVFIDISPIKGNNYYRLKQVDYDGQFEYSDVIAINIDFTTTPFQLTSNVANDNIEVTGEGTALIVNHFGQVLKQINLSGTESINVSDLPSGIYFIKENNSTVRFLKL